MRHREESWRKRRRKKKICTVYSLGHLPVEKGAKVMVPNKPHERQTDRQTDRQTETDRQTQRQR